MINDKSIAESCWQPREQIEGRCILLYIYIYLESTVNEFLLVDLFEYPPNTLHKGRIHCFVIVSEINPTSQSIDKYVEDIGAKRRKNGKLEDGKKVLREYNLQIIFMRRWLSYRVTILSHSEEYLITMLLHAALYLGIPSFNTSSRVQNMKQKKNNK